MAGAARSPAVLPAGMRVRRHLVRHQLLWLAALYIVLLGCCTALALATLRTREIDASQHALAALTRVIEEQTTRSLQTADLRLQLAADGIGHLAEAGQLNEASARSSLQGHLRELSFALSMAMLDARGILRGNAIEGGVGTDLSGRDYFQAVRTQQRPGLVIGKPAQGTVTTTRWRLPVARAIRGADGRFIGIVTAGIDPQHFEKTWSSVDLGENYVISLYHRDATLMLRSPLDPSELGKPFPQMTVFSAAYAGRAEGQFRKISVMDGADRYFAFRRLALHPDLVLVVGQSSAVILANWWRMAALAISLWLLASTAIAALSLYLHRARRKHAQSERRARDLGQRLDLATSAAGIGAWDWNLATDSGNASPGYFTMLGEPPSDLTLHGHSWLDRCHPDDLDLVRDQMQRALGSLADDFEYEVRLRHANGSYRWVRLVGRVTERDAGHRPLRMVGVRQDIHQRRLAEDALRRSEAFNTTVLDSVNAQIAVLDRDGVIRAVNAPWRRFALDNHYQPDGAVFPSQIGVNYLEVCRTSVARPRDDHGLASQAYNGIRAVLERRQAHFFLEYPCHGATSDRWFMMHCTPLGGADGGVVIAHNDITARMAAENKLRQMVRLYALRVQVSRAIIDHRDQLGLLQQVSHVAIAFGGLRMAWIGVQDPDAAHVQALASAGQDDGFLDQLRRTGEDGISAGLLPRPRDGSDVMTFADIAAETQLSAWRDAALQRGYRSCAVVAFSLDRNPCGSLHLFAVEPGFFTPGESQMLRDIGQDISFALARIASEQARERAELALHGLLQDKEALLKEVHHRVKNNLQVVSSLLRLESAREVAPATRAVLRDMQGRIQAMALLHETLYGAGKFALVDLAHYLRQLATQAFTTFSSRPSDVRLRLELSPVEVSMNQAITCGLLVNELVSNGLKHGFPHGRSGEVCIQLRSCPGPGRMQLRISDTGIGLPPDFAQRQVESLGLQLASDLAGQLGGTLQVGPIPSAVFAVDFTADSAG